jgi:SAM-dependent methyltransferase
MKVYAEPRRSVALDDCFFYHAMSLPGAGAVGHAGWDLRGHVDEYLGNVTLADKRVLEIGPANGFLTFAMEERGADVVAVELQPTTPMAVVPYASLDTCALTEDHLATMEQVRNGFWFAHQATGSSARVHYGNAHELPAELGRFDVAVMAAMLLHTRDPLQIIENCASLSGTLVIVERHFAELGDVPVARLEPTVENELWHTWWSFSPTLLVNFCEVLGFADVTVTFHEQRHFWPDGDMLVPMFTVVARQG